MDIIELLDNRGVPYLTSGKNVKRGCVNIKCPFCGEADTSFHLGIELATGKWACWRNVDHRGRSLPRLLQKLLGCSYEAAQELIAGHTEFSSVADRLQPKAQQQATTKEKLTKERGLVYLADVPPKDMPLYKRFWDYLHKRGFDFNDAMPAAIGYGLQCALTGRFKNRIIFPVVIEQETVGYTGRCIDGGSLRYLSHPGPVVKQNILWYDSLKAGGGRKLFVTEGPFDAMKLDYGLQKCGSEDRATCLFGVSHTAEQRELLYNLRPRFEELVILFDQNALAPALSLASTLSNLLAKVQTLPQGIDDPGQLSWESVKQIAEQML
jgi:hypothetical protein